jgi:hypothetical protein
MKTFIGWGLRGIPLQREPAGLSFIGKGSIGLRGPRLPQGHCPPIGSLTSFRLGQLAGEATSPLSPHKGI